MTRVASNTIDITATGFEIEDSEDITLDANTITIRGVKIPCLWQAMDSGEVIASFYIPDGIDDEINHVVFRPDHPLHVKAQAAAQSQWV